jgi:hypothetical protein
MMNRWVALAFGGSVGVLMLFAAGSLKLGDVGMKETDTHAHTALSDDGAETVPGRALSDSDAPSLRLVPMGGELMTVMNSLSFATSDVAP